jgi:acyl-CoA thioesterase-1
VTKAALDARRAISKSRSREWAASSLGQNYKTRFDAIYPALAKKYDAPLYPFFSKG